MPLELPACPVCGTRPKYEKGTESPEHLYHAIVCPCGMRTAQETSNRYWLESRVRPTKELREAWIRDSTLIQANHCGECKKRPTGRISWLNAKGQPTLVFVMCLSCETRAGIQPTWSGAIDTWNRVYPALGAEELLQEALVAAVLASLRFDD